MKNSLIIFILILSGCNLNDKTSKEEIAHLYVDILVAEEQYKTDGDSLKIVVDSLHATYGIDKLKYLEQLENYKYDVETWDKFFAIAEEYLDSLKAQENRKGK